MPFPPRVAIKMLRLRSRLRADRNRAYDERKDGKKSLVEGIHGTELELLRDAFAITKGVVRDSARNAATGFENFRQRRALEQWGRLAFHLENKHATMVRNRQPLCRTSRWAVRVG